MANSKKKRENHWSRDGKPNGQTKTPRSGEQHSIKKSIWETSNVLHRTTPPLCVAKLEGRHRQKSGKSTKTTEMANESPRNKMHTYICLPSIDHRVHRKDDCHTCTSYKIILMSNN